MFNARKGFHCGSEFYGVRFVLYGFDPGTHEEVRGKLISEGGVDVGEYGQDCTHLIVDKIVYDDPVCVAARRDGKKVVSRLWIEHSLEEGVQFDVTSILYRPVKDLDGISGAKHLIMCLTGYDRPFRDDIMIMVGLMGAQFSKPLVANKITHLICYKFEGQKYELAKILNTIKLVNHRWIEDCLKAWELLPVDDYNISGHDLEIREAEAKDSEDETEDVGAIVSPRSKSNASPHALPKKLQGNHGASLIGEIVPTKPATAKEVDQPAQQSSVFGDAVNGTSTKSANTKVPLSNGVESNEQSKSADLKSLGDAESTKFQAFCYSRKTPRRSGLSLHFGENWVNGAGYPSAHLDKHKLKDEWQTSPFKHQVGTNRTDSEKKAELDVLSHQMRKMYSGLDVSPLTSKLRNLGASSSAKRMDAPDPTTLAESSGFG